MSDLNQSTPDVNVTSHRNRTTLEAVLAESGTEADPFADGSTAVFEPKAPAAGAATGGASGAAPQADPFADPGVASSAPAVENADAAVTMTQAEVPVPEEAQGLFGGAFSGLGGLVAAADAGSFGIASAALAAAGSGSGNGRSGTESDEQAGAFSQQNLQSGISTVAFGLDRGAADTPVEGPVGVVSQVLLNVVPGGDDANDITAGRGEYPNFFGFFGPGQEQAQQGFNDTVGQILTTEFNDQLTAELLPVATAIGSIAADQPLITNNE